MKRRCPSPLPLSPSPGGLSAVLLGTVLCVLLLARPVAAQEGVPLFLVDEGTTVSSVDFQFESTRSFDESRLKEEIATEAPSFLDKVYRILPLVSMDRHPFAPVQLQRDVARLRAFYRQNGFLQPEIGYAPTVLDTSANEIDVVFSIEEGPPLVIQDVTFFGPDSTGYAVRQFEEAVRERWIALRDANPHRVGERYSAVNRQLIQSEALAGLKNAGFAFARTGSEARVDSSANTVDLRYYIDAGPRARIDEIQVEGNTSVRRQVVLRELPFQVGDWFDAEDLAQGQRELFGLQLFRVALASVPEQPRDSTVTVRYTVREASLRYLTAEGGYARDLGATSEGRWTHRNFLGDARELSVGLIANTGFGAGQNVANTAPPRLFRTSASVRQPYLFTTKLSGVASIFAEFESNPQLVENPDQLLAVNAGEVGLSTTAIYEFMPFRTFSARYALSRALQFRPEIRLNEGTGTDPLAPDSLTTLRRDVFSRSVLSLNATLGRADDYVSPTRGFLVRPFVEAGLSLPVSGGVEYLKTGGQLTGYLPVADRVSLAGRLAGGHLWLYGRSRAALSGQRRLGGPFTTYENRFDPIYFYTGGSNDVRGWATQQAGAKFARAALANLDEFVPGNSDYLYESVGGRSKLAVSGEVRMPFPGLGENWRTAFFLDAGQVWGAESPVVELTDGPFDEDTAADDFVSTNFRYGTGGGIRYRTPVGFLRLDLALKLNPSFEDLRDPEEVFEYNECRTSLVATSCNAPAANDWRRLRLHLSIGQSF